MYFSDQDKEKIRRSVIEAEKKTSGEIVPVIIRASDAYPGSYYRSALLWGFVCVLCCYFFEATHTVMFWCFSASILAGYLLCYLDFYKKLFITKQEMEEEFSQRAYQSFLMNGVSQTKERNGVMLYISAFEKKAMIVSDTGIEEKIKPGTWEKVITDLISLMKTKDYTSAICQAVTQLGTLLNEHFPDHKDDEDELANKLIIEV
ncbi:MAG: TPM domain-containing protein [Bacteriovoracaceae bacterium]